MRFRLLVPRRFQDELLTHARRELPNECCGLLAGKVTTDHKGESVARVERCFPLINAAASPVEYLSDAHSMFAAVREMRAPELEILAVYHSHPTSHPVPSGTDLDRNYSEEVINFIISLAGDRPEIRAWWLKPDDYAEADWEWIEDDVEKTSRDG